MIFFFIGGCKWRSLSFFGERVANGGLYFFLGKRCKWRSLSFFGGGRTAFPNTQNTTHKSSTHPPPKKDIKLQRDRQKHPFPKKKYKVTKRPPFATLSPKKDIKLQRDRHSQPPMKKNITPKML